MILLALKRHAMGCLPTFSPGSEVAHKGLREKSPLPTSRQGPHCPMLTGLISNWRKLKSGQPGRRFQQRAARRRHDRSSRSLIRRFVEPASALILMGLGLFFCLVPGPGIPLLFLGAAILAERSRPVARALDWSEMKARKVIAYARAWWRRAPVRKKVAVVLGGVLGLVGAGFGAYSITFGRE
jgi:hypothetical protein